MKRSRPSENREKVCFSFKPRAVDKRRNNRNQSLPMPNPFAPPPPPHNMGPFMTPFPGPFIGPYSGPMGGFQSDFSSAKRPPTGGFHSDFSTAKKPRLSRSGPPPAQKQSAPATQAVPGTSKRSENASNSQANFSEDKKFGYITRFKKLTDPELLCVNGETKFTKQLLRHYDNKKQTRKIFLKKIRIWEELAQAFSKVWPASRIHVFGSSLSGFGSGGSDIDLCIFPYWETNKPPPSEKNWDVQFLRHFRKMMQSRIRMSTGQVTVIPAKVPIVQFTEREHGFEVDLSVQQEHGIRNTHLLHAYGMLDPRVRPLVFCVKSWATFFQINDAKNSSLSSYSISLLVLHFLQAGASPPVLPALHAVVPDIYDPKLPLFGLNFENPMPGYRSTNKQSLGSLFADFMTYYTDKWDFANDVASIRTGQRLTNKDCFDYSVENSLPRGQWSAYVCVEEPLNRTNAARAVVRREAFEKILDAFYSTKKKLSKDKDHNNINMAAILGPYWDKSGHNL